MTYPPHAMTTGSTPDPRDARPTRDLHALDLHRPTTWRDIVDSWAWPRLLSAWRFALRPAHLGMSAVLLVSLLLALTLAESLAASLGKPGGLGEFEVPLSRELARLPVDWSQMTVSQALYHLLAILRAHAWTLALLALPAALVFGLLGGALARGVGECATRAAPHPWSTLVSLSLRKLASTASVLLGPALLLGVGAGLFTLVGGLLHVPYVGTAAAIAFGLVMILCLLLVVLIVVLALASPMLVPAVMIEGTDAIDATQRSMAYVIAKPAHFAAGALLLLAQGWLLVRITALLTHGALSLSIWVATALVGERGRSLGIATSLRTGEPPTGDALPIHHLLCFWSKLLQSLPAVVGLSFFIAAGTLLYLWMRRVCDGQDESEIVDPARSSRIEMRTRAAQADTTSAPDAE